MKTINYLKFIISGLIITVLLAACVPFEGTLDEVREKASGGSGLRWTVKFDSKGGSVVSSQSVKDGNTATRPKDPTRTGSWNFEKWCSDADCTIEYDFSTPVTADITLYADWSNTDPNRHLIRFYNTGDSTIPSQLVSNGAKVNKPVPDPIRSGYVFDGWYEDVNIWNQPWNFDNPVTKATDLYAKWVGFCIVKFDANNGTGMTSEEALVYSETPKTLPPISLIAPTNPFGSPHKSYIFTGWAKTADAVVPDYLSGNNISFASLDAEAGGTVTLYAVWVVNKNIIGSTLSAQLDWLKANAISNETYFIDVAAISGSKDIDPFTLSSDQFDNESKITIELGANVASSVNLNLDGSMFTIEDGFTLVLSGNLTLQGRISNNASVVRVNAGGALEMKGNAQIIGNTNTGNGGGVFVTGAGSSFTMSGSAKITGNTALTGGGVHMESGGHFTMSAGTIVSNRATNTTSTGGGGGVYVTGSGSSFTLSAGTITQNETTYGGGVCVTDSGNFTMNGGTIGGTNATDGNTGRGGGVYVTGSGSSFDMSAGTISRNSTPGSGPGGGVSVVNSGNFTMSGSAVISGNIATADGGGVYLFTDVIFTMSGNAEISGNTGSYGGGVCMGTRVSFTMSGWAIIKDNIATTLGGGVFNSTGGPNGSIDYCNFIMNGGTISGNTVVNGSGGGVCINPGYFTMNSGTISGNTADGQGDGGGVYIGGGSFNMNGGSIGGNTVTRAYGGGGGVYVFQSATFSKTNPATIYGTTGDINGSRNNIGDNTSTGRGYAVYVTTPAYRDTTITQGILSYNPNASPPLSGSWE